MALVTMKTLLDWAENNRCGIGAFSIGNMEMLKGTIQAAETMNTPIILQIAEGRLRHSPLHLMGPMMVQAAREARVDVAVHLDHGRTMQCVEKALELGFTSVMYDGSALPLEENIRRTNVVSLLAGKYGATVEGELGVVGGSEDEEAERQIAYTDPEEARIFREATGVDALAVAIGNAHGNYRWEPKLAFDILEEIRRKTHMPLVLHGGSGITDADFQKAISLGIVKVNIATATFNQMMKQVRQGLDANRDMDYYALNEALVLGAFENVKHHIEVFNC